MGDAKVRSDSENSLELLDRTRGLFEFLRACQQLKITPIRSVESYERDGAVIWLDSLPDHPAVSRHLGEDPGVDDPLFQIDRVPSSEPPRPGQLLVEWVDGPVDKLGNPPTLRDSISVAPDDGSDETDWIEQLLVDHPEVSEAFGIWMTEWLAWAERERQDKPVRDVYLDLFRVHGISSAQAESFELVLGVGYLVWQPEGHDEVLRHTLVAPAIVELDEDTGRLTVRPRVGLDPLTLELDMLDPGVISNPQSINDVKEDCRNFEGHPLDRKLVEPLARRLVNLLDALGEYTPRDDIPELGPGAVVSFSPALIMRKRSQQGIVDIFNAILRQMGEAQGVPAGLLPLIDPEGHPDVESESSDGAIAMIGDEPFLPLPVNERQLRVIQAIDSRAQVVVQGPPGTGKTHTAAALISHLLAQGKRVLVTAHTDRALREIRGKLPEAIRPLSVAVVGKSGDDMADLKVAVGRIADNAAEFDQTDSQKDREGHLATIDRLERERAELQNQLVDARSREVREFERGSYRGTLAAIAQQYRSDDYLYAWLRDLLEIGPDTPCPVSNEDIQELLAMIRDAELAADEQESALQLIPLARIPNPNDFDALCESERSASEHLHALDLALRNPNYPAVHGLSPQDRAAFKSRIQDLVADIKQLQGRPEPWMERALVDVVAHRSGEWEQLWHRTSRLIAEASPHIEALGVLTDVSIDPASNLPALMAMANEVLKHLRSGGKLKISADGSPKIGALTAKPVKQSELLFEQVKVNGLPPTTETQLGFFLRYGQALKYLGQLEQDWSGLSTPSASLSTLRVRLEWFNSEAEQLRRALSLGHELKAAEKWMTSAGIGIPHWLDYSEALVFVGLVDAASARDHLDASEQPLRDLEQEIASAAGLVDSAPCTADLMTAVQGRDAARYRSSYIRLARLHEVVDSVARRQELEATVPLDLLVAMKGTSEDRDWDIRLASFKTAWEWCSVGSWIAQMESLDVNELQERVRRCEEDIRSEVEQLAANKAWAHAVGADRLTGTAKADLYQYVQLVKTLGKGTGKFAPQQRRDIRKAMDRCRSSVPVWIMPIYRIAEQLLIHEDMFDVVIIDEASQAGLEAVFLQYLAPKIVVVGDDKQVSPSAPGVDQQKIRDLADRHIAKDRYYASWIDPTRSLFDEALMRYREKIVLTEHRRCVPEIIGFSNRIAYGPEGVTLIPVRQYGADRLDPIKAVHVPSGYELGQSGYKTNPAEADAIVDQIEKCLTDSRYDGLTIGVISLLGNKQARLIESKLMDRIPSEEWTARDLRCGDAADFQGSERDVVFLSMVVAPGPGRRPQALTHARYVQRYNVAASRAKDQLWLFHSVPLQDLSNKEDMRFQLLDYCYGVIGRGQSEDERIATELVPEDVRVDPFDSLFEQRVFNRIVDRGYSVIPQYPAQGYSIDLVVVGAKGKLAVECDGDAWHGPDVYQQDLARQRELERCGWKFFRIRESAFYVDQGDPLARLWKLLDELDIRLPVSDPAELGQAESSDASHQPEPLVLPATGRREVATSVKSSDDTMNDVADADQAVADTHVAPDNVVGIHDFTESPFAEAEENAWDDSQSSTISSTGLLPYNEFAGRLTAPDDASQEELVEGLIEIVRVEGPVIGQRLRYAYVKAAGGKRVGSHIGSVLNKALYSGMRKGLLLSDNPLNEAGIQPLTIRLESQPLVVPRELGPRSLDQVPPRELASLIAANAAEVGWVDEVALMRATLASLGLRRLTPNVEVLLRSLISLAKSDGG